MHELTLFLQCCLISIFNVIKLENRRKQLSKFIRSSDDGFEKGVVSL